MALSRPLGGGNLIGNVFNNHNARAVRSGPTDFTIVHLTKETTIATIQTYHWNGGAGARPGTISLRTPKGKIYGPWQCVGVKGQGGVPNAYWECHPGIVLPAGRYLVVDSSPMTWSANAHSRGSGMVRIDGGENSAHGSGSIVGQWKWVDGQRLAIFGDGTFKVFVGKRQINTGSWKRRADGAFVFRHKNDGWVDVVSLSKDGLRLSGKNQTGNPLNGTKILPSSSFRPSIPRPTPTIVGKWNWVSNQKLIIHSNGTSETFLNGKRINTGRWKKNRNGSYTLTHAKGGWQDTVRLSADGKVLSGKNNRNITVSGRKQ